MKRAYRLRALASLYDQLRSDDFDRREHALFQLAMLLRRSRDATSQPALPDYVNASLPRDLLRLRLSTQEMREAVDRLTQVMIERPQSRATAIWALGEVEAEFALASTLACIINIGGQLHNEAAFQACAALAGWLSAQEAALAGAELADLRALLMEWAGAADARLSQRADDLLAQLPAP
ncbi:MAG: hypothetical protein OXE95_09330 [Chloroflexi bacterium]|nr:hypothetical protein [Chloroflexota bacterium]MCY4247759.1 hypothetical protein [Chloroflexota bacterium]